MKEIDCKSCRDLIPDLLLEPGRAPATAQAHVLACTDRRTELEELQATMAVMDAWTAPEPSQYFDARVRARLREAQAEAPGGLWERMVDTLQFSTGWGLRSALAGLFVFVLLLGGGTAATFWGGHHHAPLVSSPTVNDLRVLDNNAQALQQMDLLEDPGPDGSMVPPQT